jgi:hypothetical protein
MIQALKNKIRDIEFVCDILKEELLKATGEGSSMEEINALIIRKTLGGNHAYIYVDMNKSLFVLHIQLLNSSLNNIFLCVCIRSWIGVWAIDFIFKE